VRILVTGGAGFIGSQYVRALLGGQYPIGPDIRVTVLDALTYAGNPANLASVAADPRYAFVLGDVRHRATVIAAMAGHDAVVNFAAESHVDRSIAGAAEFVTTNVVGAQTLLEAALERGVGRFVQVSTDEVYGSILAGSWTEDTPLAPSSPYAASKAAADLLALAYHHTHGLDVVITRGSNTYGPYQHPEKLIPLFVTNLLDGLPVPLYGDGRQVRQWMHVADHCAGIDRALRLGRPGQVYHLAGADELANVELTARLLDACGRDVGSVTHVADRPGHDQRYSLDTARSRAELGFTPTVPFDQGLAATIDWYRAHRAWWAPQRPAPG
jgi:dTDP-glucose 4,6-dehydratase